MTVEAHAKVNLTLEVYGTRPDGYHALRSLVAPISLSDTLDIETTDDGSITSDTGFPDDLCVKAARTLARAAGQRSEVRGQTVEKGACIRVTKRIPVGGGLGGGSADAAATLRALNELWHLGRTPEELAEIGAAVGSDVPALVLAQHYHRIVLMEGRGEKVTPLLTLTSNLGLHSPFPVPCSLHLILSNPGIPVPTAEVYRLCAPRTEPADGAVNDLQGPAVRIHPEIGDALAALKAAGATDVMMSGSGSSVFGFAPDESAAKRIAGGLAAAGLKSWSVTLLVGN